MSALRPERWQVVAPLLDRLFETPEEERPALAVALAGEDASLGAELAALIAAGEASGGILDRSPDEYVRSMTDESEPDGDVVGERIGAWRIQSEIGRGGMGVVYLAERADGAFEQRVALKLLRRGIDTGEVLERFRRERQILARLEHPHIARVLDGGATVDGRPYFAMEYVEGQPITAWCDARGASVEERLRLFIDVCAAVDHAHRRLVVHRDLKPTNILVTAAGEVKLLDFGIAKLLGAGEEGVTRVGRRPMTPRYAAPEQVQGDAVTTATDTYALGLVLYELLVGRSPYRLAHESEAELERAVLEQQPEAPSAAVTRRAGGQHQRPEEIAAARRTTPERLRRTLRGDPDAIVVTALRKEPDRRYPSAESLRADVERHVVGLPVWARSDTLRYRTWKFLRRHRVAAAAAALVVLSLAGGFAAAAWQAHVAAREKVRAEQVSEFLVELFTAADPVQTLGDTVSVREILDRGSERIERELAGDPGLQAQLMHTIADVYWGLGIYHKAGQLFERAVELRERVDGPDHPATLNSMNALANVRVRDGRFDEGVRMFRSTLERRRRTLGDDHPDTLRSMNDLAFWYGEIGRYGDATALQSEVIEARRRVLGPEHYDSLWSMNDLAVVYVRVGRYQEAEALLLAVLEAWRRQKIAEDPDAFMDNLADAYQGQERYDEAERLLREVLDNRLRVFGAEHPQTLSSMRNLAVLFCRRARYDESEKLLREALELDRRILGHEHPETLASASSLAKVYWKQGRLDDAEPMLRNALEIQRRTLGARHPGTVGSIYDLACLLARRGRRDDSLEGLREAVAAGYPNATWMSRDGDLAGLRGDPSFERLVAAARENAVSCEARAESGASASATPSSASLAAVH